MANVRYSNQQQAQCVIRMENSHQETAIQPNGFTKRRKTVSSRHALSLWNRNYKEHGSHTYKSDNGREAIGVETQNKIAKMFEASAKRLLQEIGVVHGFITERSGIS